jgi:hypothetical protein
MMMRIASSRVVILALLAVTLATSAQAQYFGRNKVRYKAFGFEVLKTDHFDIYFYPAEGPAAHLAARMAERWYTRLSRLFGHELGRRQPILLYAGHPDFEQTNAIVGELDEGTGGVTEVLKRRVVLPFAGPLRETDHVLGHELVHAFQFDIVGRLHGSMGTLPLWFVEGMAEYLSLGPTDSDTEMWMRDAVRSGTLPTLRELAQPRYFPYRYGEAFWAYVAGRWGDESIGAVLKAATRSRGPYRALTKVLGLTDTELSKEWQAALRAAYAAPAGIALGRELVAHPDKHPPFHLGPALSPDGERLIYFATDPRSSALELFLADVRTGKVLRHILHQSLDPHFESLEFIQSAGAWDDAGHRFAFAGVRGGHAVLSVLDVERGTIERETALPALEEVLNPTWSPDGNRVAFSALHGGLTDIFIYDVASDHLEQITDDPYADLQPAWSPDGAWIAFVTDRFSTNLHDFSWGTYQLARLNVQSGTIDRLPSFSAAKNINPQWGAGGKTLYFLSDRSGVTNVYRLAPDTGVVTQVTDLAVGVSGLTALSPALASAAHAERLVVTVYDHGGYHLRAIEEPTTLAGVAVDLDDSAAPRPLPPAERVPSTLVAMLHDPTRGLPEPSTAATLPLRTHLTLDRVGEPYLAVGSDPFGVFVTGGASLFWSDMLGNHNVVTALGVKGSFKDLAGVIGYQNRSRRWIWGVGLQQLTYVGGTVSSGLGEQDGRAVSLQQAVRFRETDRRLSGVLAYPFSRSDRLDITASYRDARFSNDVTTRAFSLENGDKLTETKSGLPAPAPLHLLELGGALVHDSARFGPTGPVLGVRSRLEVTPATGSLVFAGLLADVRKYVMPVRPFTLAGRLLHYGRYGPDAQDRRLAPLFLGYPNLVRGYDFDAFGVGTCIPGGCPRIQSLVGSRLLVGNVELRVPAFAFLGRGREYGPIPTELALFYDTGVAWSVGERPSVFGGARAGVASWGAALRINLLGFLIGELDYIRPLDLAGVKSQWRLVLTPGF